MAIKVLFHSYGNGKHCPDGFGAAYVLWRCFGETAEYIPCVYQEPPPQISKGDEVYVVDFSFPREWLDTIEKSVPVMVLDHHKTAQADLDGLHFAVFDMARSGAQLVWDYFIRDKPQPDLIRYIADRDLWKKELSYTEEVHRALQMFPQDFIVWNTLANLPNYVDFMRRIGEPIYQQHLKAVEELAASAKWHLFAGYRVLSTHTANYSLVSDALNLICQRHPETPFAVNFNWSQDNKSLKFELRSVGDFDVSAIAKSFGGGGHRNAAGCTVDHRDERLKEFFCVLD